MTQSRLSKLDFSKKRLTQLQSKLQGQLQDVLLQKSEEVSDQSTRLRKQFEERSSVVSGRLRDASLERLYEAGATTLSTAAELLAKVSGAQQGAEQLREGAKAAEQAKASVQLPAIDNYDDLNVGQVKEALDGLSAYQLDKVRRYEKAHKNRVTVLRELDQRIDS
jgi:uncharacterized protein with von Willebrand factor type A (vWA) domain